MDLTAGRTTRPHADVDVMILERDEHALRTDLEDVELTLVSGPKNEEQPWPAGRRGPCPSEPRSRGRADHRRR